MKEKEKKKGIFDPSIAEHRERVAHAKPMLEPAADVDFFDILVPIREDVRIPTRIYTPKLDNATGSLPTVFYIPGTAFVATETAFTRVICSHLAKMAKCRVVVVNHRLAPENQSPIGFMDSYDVIKFFVFGQQQNHIIDRGKIAIVGYSSGGNFAALISAKAKKDGVVLRKQILVSPIVDLSRSLKGFDEYEQKDTDISQEFVNWFIDLYLSEKAHPKSPSISPFWLPKNELKEYPPTDILMAEYDRFRNDAEFFYFKLKEYGIPVDKHVAAGEKHSYLWYKLEVTEKISERLRISFKDENPDLRFHGTISKVKPRIPAIEEKKDQTVPPLPKSKL